VAAHKKHVVVAGVARYPDAVPRGIDSFDEVLDFLTGARDGSGSADVFYLGQLPARTGRFCARLDSLHTIPFCVHPLHGTAPPVAVRPKVGTAAAVQQQVTRGHP
jgi:hypothetical protein